MKKSSIRKLLFLLAALFLLTGVEYASAVPAEAAGYKTLYKKFLRKKYKEKGMDGYTKKFFIINIDKKGVPELVYTDGSYGPSAHGVFEVYTIKKGKVKKAGEFTNRTAASSFQYNGKNKAEAVSLWIGAGRYHPRLSGKRYGKSVPPGAGAGMPPAVRQLFPAVLDLPGTG